jgi:hypothetical protein
MSWNNEDENEEDEGEEDEYKTVNDKIIFLIDARFAICYCRNLITRNFTFDIK